MQATLRVPTVHSAGTRRSNHFLPPRITEATADLAAIVGEGRSRRIVGPRARRYGGPHRLPVLMHMHVHPRRWGSGNADASVHRRVAVHDEFVYVLGKHP